MLRHIVLLTMTDGTSDAQIDTIVDGLRALADLDGLEQIVVGRDAGLSDGAATVGFTADFTDVDAWRAYQVHPRHKQLIADHIAPVLAAKSAIQLSL